MQGTHGSGCVEGMPQCLSVNEHDLQSVRLFVFGYKSVQPTKEAGLKSNRIDIAQERPNAVSTGCFAFRQIESCLQPIFLGAAPASDGFCPFGSGNDRGDAHRYDVLCGMQNVDRCSGIFDFCTDTPETLHRFETDFHDRSPPDTNVEQSMPEV